MKGLGDVPLGFVEIDPLTVWSVQGRPHLEVKGPPPVFIRAKFVNIRGQAPEPAFPRWLMYCGPTTKAQVPFLVQQMQRWIQAQRPDGFWTVYYELAYLAPNGFQGYNWPWRETRMVWRHEPAPPQPWVYSGDPFDPRAQRWKQLPPHQTRWSYG